MNPEQEEIAQQQEKERAERKERSRRYWAFRSELGIHIHHLHANKYVLGSNEQRADHHKKLHDEGDMTYPHEHQDFYGLDDMRSLNGR